MKIYAISGKAQHGKDFTSDLIVDCYKERYNKKVCRLANGDYLKFLVKYIGWDGTKTPEMRNLLQQFGTEYVRKEIDDDFWVNQVIMQINILKPYYDTFTIADSRFPNEIEKLKKVFGSKNVISLRVKRFDENGNIYASSLSEEQLQHPSEVALDDYKFDYYLHNSNANDTKIGVHGLVRAIEGFQYD